MFPVLSTQTYRHRTKGYIEDPDPTMVPSTAEDPPDLEGSLFDHIWGYELPETSLWKIFSNKGHSSGIY